MTTLTAETPEVVAAGVPVGWLVAAPLLAFPLTMVGLLASSTEQTPQAYVGLVPFVVLAVLAARPDSPAPPSAGAVGWGAVATAALLVVLAAVTDIGWDLRTDTLAIAVAAFAAAVAFGRSTARWWCAGLGLFAWIAPYDEVLTPHLEDYAGVTVRAVDVVTSVTGLAERIPGTSLFHLPSQDATQTLDVAVSCSGINGAVAMLLVGLAVGAVTQGSWRRRIAWIVVGVAAQWVANLIRILVLFAITRWIGVDVAIDIVHPVIGLVFFNVVVLVMVGSLGRWGLELPRLSVPRDPGQRRRWSAVVVLAVCNLLLGSAALRAAGVQPPEASTMICPATPGLYGHTRADWSAATDRVAATCAPNAGSLAAHPQPATGQ